MEATDLICFSCKHFRRFYGGCDAFPDGIPSEITSGENDHSEPLPGQENAIVYEAGEPQEDFGEDETDI
jgi:hypothetical protein